MDDEQLPEMQKKMLESFGYKVAVLTSSIEDQDTFEKSPDLFDLIITDMTIC